MTNELKPCPFCPDGGEADTMPSLSGDWWQAGCKKCGISTRHYMRRKQAIKAWNTRYERTCKPFDKYFCGVPLCGNCGVELKMIVSGVRPFNKILPNFCHMCGSKVVTE